MLRPSTAAEVAVRRQAANSGYRSNATTERWATLRPQLQRRRLLRGSLPRLSMADRYAAAGTAAETMWPARIAACLLRTGLSGLVQRADRIRRWLLNIRARRVVRACPTSRIPAECGRRTRPAFARSRFPVPSDGCPQVVEPGDELRDVARRCPSGLSRRPMRLPMRVRVSPPK